MIVIVDYGMGNLASIANMLKKAGHASTITSDRGQVAGASKLVLPGVGAFDAAMQNLARLHIVDVLHQRVADSVPVLGICLGMQLMTKRSEEGVLSGLGWIDAEMKRFEPGAAEERLRVPHMGWNAVDVRKESRLFHDMPADPRFYFVHSYYAACNPDDELTSTTHGIPFSSAFEHENIAGVQFHPEKSHRFGLRLLKNFAELF